MVVNGRGALGSGPSGPSIRDAIADHADRLVEIAHREARDEGVHRLLIRREGAAHEQDVGARLVEGEVARRPQALPRIVAVVPVAGHRLLQVGEHRLAAVHERERPAHGDRERPRAALGLPEDGADGEGTEQDGTQPAPG
ncbi:MAG: hypothetical protein QM820_02190 [Minicystis sp.]